MNKFNYGFYYNSRDGWETIVQILREDKNHYYVKYCEIDYGENEDDWNYLKFDDDDNERIHKVKKYKVECSDWNYGDMMKSINDVLD
eukprot:gene13114-8656_t